MLELGQCQVHLSIKELLLWDHDIHDIHDVLDLRSGILGLLSFWVRGHDALVKCKSFTQVLRFVLFQLQVPDHMR